ncbi:ARM repeat superfamily protein [Striga hermonthica]|uniref:ARM repeat superfamily protein n=1 Tax=Striga hermonthica TaxID=68872 RepID=A0A9N7MD39_STRHE|nr:ARM repeat superfamily protein [Striga hermonthica]
MISKSPQFEVHALSHSPRAYLPNHFPRFPVYSWVVVAKSLNLHPQPVLSSPFFSLLSNAMKEPADEQPIKLNPHLADIQQLLHSLLESASHVQILKSKWSLIINKLSTLQARLSDLSIPSAGDNPLSCELLRSVSSTFASASSLAAVCRSPTPPGGKLRTQNEVDSLSAKLDAHINDLEVLAKSGALSEPNAAVSSGIFPASRRESVRAEARNLMTRLQIGSNEPRSLALDSLLGLLQEDDKHVIIAVAQGLVPVLVHLLDSSPSSEIKEKTVTAVAKISTVDSSKHVLLAEGLGLLNNLLRVLESGSVFAKEKSCVALTVLSNSKENARAIASRGGISSLLEVCQVGTPNSQALAAGVLQNLAAFEEIKDSFIEENAVSILLGLCDSGTLLAQENSIGCLCNLVSGNDNLKLLVAREGIIENLKNLADSASTAQNLEVVARMVSTLASCPNIAESLVANGFVDRVLNMLSSGVLGVRIAAANALCDLGYNNKIKKELGEIGCIRLLVGMLDGKATEEKEAAAKVLSMLMNFIGNRRIFRKVEKGIVSVVQLLDPLVKNLDKKYLVSILASLMNSKKCRKQMVAAGACVYLPKLVESDVEGAKKLLDGLERGKLWGVFGRALS